MSPNWVTPWNTPDAPASRRQIGNFRSRVRVGKLGSVDFNTLSQVFAGVKGIEYPTWVNDNSRTVVTPGALNELLVMQIESLFRDVLFKEVNLTADASTDTDTIICADLRGDTDTYYSGAYVYNFTRGAVRAVDSYTASTHTLELASAITSQGEGDLFAVFNIQGSDQINYASFDALVTSGGSRESWKGAFSVSAEMDSFDLISSIAQEAGIVWRRDGLNRETVGTLGNLGGSETYGTITSADVLEVLGVPQIKLSQTSPDEIFNDFTVNYRIDYVSGQATETLNLNQESTTLTDDTRSGFRDAIEAYTALCADSVATYKAVRPLVVDLEYIRETATANLKLKQLADLYSHRFLVAEMDLVHNANTVRFEEGDILKLNHALVPEVSRNTSYWVITEWQEIPSTATYHIVCRELPWGTA